MRNKLLSMLTCYNEMYQNAKRTSLAKMSAHESRKMARDTFPGLSLALMKKALREEQKNGCRLRIGSLLVSVLLERSRLVLTPVSSGMYS